jgi:endoglucanase
VKVKLIQFALLICIVITPKYVTSQTSSTEIALIRVDQFGYYEDQIKIAVLADPQLGVNSADSYNPSDNIKLIDASNAQAVLDLSKTIVDTGNTDALSGDKLWHIDFTSFNTPGTYYIHDLDENVRSHDFVIGENNKYDNLLRAALKQLYYQRCGHAKVSDEWTDVACHEDADQDTDCKDYHGILSNRDLSGGWHDAGDYGKYVGFAYPAVNDLLSAYLMNPTFWDTLDVGIPESSNGSPDILDEVKWELDWLLKMQVNGEGNQALDGGMLHIVGMSTDEDSYWSKHIGKPASQDKSVRWFLGVAGQSTCSGMSMLAYGAYTFNKAGMTSDANAYLVAAESAWTWTEKNPSDLNSNFEGYPANQMDSYFFQKNILYGDVNIALYEAACYLHLLTGNSKYLTYIQNNTAAIPDDSNLRGALLNYAIDASADAAVASNIKNKYLNLWGKPGTWHFKENGSSLTDGHNFPLWSAYWGANIFLCREAALVYNASSIDQNNMPWRHSLISSASSYMHGCNPLDLVYITSVGGSDYGGERYLDLFYHGDSNMEAMPPAGCIPGGPNGSFSGTSPLLPANSPALKRFDPSQQATPVYQYFEGQVKAQAAYVYLMTAVIDAFGPKGTITGINKQVDSQITIYPNPSNDVFQISKKVAWSIYNSVGQKIKEGNSNKVDLSAHPTGVYIFETIDGLQKKLIKK